MQIPYSSVFSKDSPDGIKTVSKHRFNPIGTVFKKSNVIDPSKDLEAFNIDTIYQTSFESCPKLCRIKYPQGIRHNIFAFRGCSSLEEIDVNENCTDIIFATNALIGSNKIKRIILRQKNAFEIPDLIYLFYRIDYPRNIKIYVRNELVDRFKSLHSGKNIRNHFAPLSEYQG
nr:MAG TPA: Cell surface protein [Caudoviricetes sp.]